MNYFGNLNQPAFIQASQIDMPVTSDTGRPYLPTERALELKSRRSAST